MSAAERVKVMKCKQLGAMISKKLDDPDYADDVQKLIDKKIDGELFLDLTKDELTEFGLSFGGKKKILSMVQEIKAGTFKWQPPAQAEDMPQEGLSCFTIPPASGIIEMTDGPTSIGGSAVALSGVVMKKDAWPWDDYLKLVVDFMNEVPQGWTVEGVQINKVNIVDWANIWRHTGGGQIPIFVLAKPREPAQIRIKFNSSGLNWSQVGIRALNPALDGLPTMSLDLHHGGNISDKQKKGYVIHEFGHALGLVHEHQRFNFWACIIDYIDMNRMKKEMQDMMQPLSDAKPQRSKEENDKFEEFWNTNYGIHPQPTPSSAHFTKYDAESVMHYWFLTSWLKDGYDDKSKVEEDRDNKTLEPEVAEALLGIHERHCSVTYEPSALDIETLQKAYPDKKAASVTGTNPANLPAASVTGTNLPAASVTGTNPPAASVIGTAVTDSPDTLPEKSTEGNSSSENGARSSGRVSAGPSEPITMQEYDVEVTSAYLSRMEWTDQGKNEVVKIYEESSHKWGVIGRNLGLTEGVLEGIKEDNHNILDRVTKVLGKWNDNACGLPHKDQYPKTWGGLINLLNKSDLGQLAGKVHEALLHQKQKRKAGAEAPVLVQPGNTGRQDVTMAWSHLTITNLAEVNEAVLDGEAKWDFIGLQLGIGAGRLEAIKTKNQGNTSSCLKDVLTEFLQQVDPEPSWKRLADAMASRSVGRGDIAKQLRKK